MNMREQTMYNFKTKILSEIHSAIAQSRFDLEIDHKGIPVDELVAIKLKLVDAGIKVYLTSIVIRLNWRNSKISYTELRYLLLPSK